MQPLCKYLIEFSRVSRVWKESVFFKLDMQSTTRLTFIDIFAEI